MLLALKAIQGAGTADDEEIEHDDGDRNQRHLGGKGQVVRGADVGVDHRAEHLGGPADDLRVPECRDCGGVLKPHVVFFGENVPRHRVDEAMAALEEAKALLVVGSSLMVFSGYRFVLAARERGRPVAMVNLGQTRADGGVSLKVQDDCAVVLPTLVA